MNVYSGFVLIGLEPSQVIERIGKNAKKLLVINLIGILYNYFR